jgi:hypothetical protein
MAKTKSFPCILSTSDIQRSSKASSSTIRSRTISTITTAGRQPFWIWDQDLHRQEDIRTKGDCCFNHIIGLPSKDKVEKPLFLEQHLPVFFGHFSISSKSKCWILLLNSLSTDHLYSLSSFLFFSFILFY